MASMNPHDSQVLRNLASALRQAQEQGDPRPRSPITDQDILRAMLGKPWNTRRADQPEALPQPVRKAG